MTFWYFPHALTRAAEEQALSSNELEIPAAGLPDLRNAHWLEQLEAWVQKVEPQMTGSLLTAQAAHYWRLSRDVMPSDHAIIRDASGQSLMVAELIDGYTHEARAQGEFHGFKVSWKDHRLPISEVLAIPDATALLDSPYLLTVADPALIEKIQSRLPSTLPRGARVLRWLTLATLIGELIYFWPR